MATVAATEFKAKCLELMDRVHERQETIVITKRGKPVAKLVPVAPASEERLYGWLRGQAWERGDIVAPVIPSDDWAVLAEGTRRRVRGQRKGSRRRAVDRLR